MAVVCLLFRFMAAGGVRIAQIARKLIRNITVITAETQMSRKIKTSARRINFQSQKLQQAQYYRKL